MGPRNNKNFNAPIRRKKIKRAKEALSLLFFITFAFSINYRPSSHNKKACTVIKYFIYFQRIAEMEAGSFLTPEEAARMGGRTPTPPQPPPLPPPPPPPPLQPRRATTPATIQKEMVPTPLLAASYKPPNVSPPLRSVVN